MIVHCLGWYYNDPCCCDWLISGIQQGRLCGSQIWHEILTFLYVFVNTADGSEIRRSPPGMDIKNVVNNVTNYQPQLVIPISEPSTLSPHFFGKYHMGWESKTGNLGVLFGFYWPWLSLKAKVFVCNLVSFVYGWKVESCHVFVYNDKEQQWNVEHVFCMCVYSYFDKTRCKFPSCYHYLVFIINWIFRFFFPLPCFYR